MDALEKTSRQTLFATCEAIDYIYSAIENGNFDNFT